MGFRVDFRDGGSTAVRSWGIWGLCVRVQNLKSEQLMVLQVWLSF